MRKIPTMFVRDQTTHKVRDEITPGCEWVILGEGHATRKWDGQCVMIRDGQRFKRREVKPEAAAPDRFELEQTDEITGKSFGWVPVTAGKEDRWLREAFESIPNESDGTFEALGPKINGNRDGFTDHVLMRHGALIAAVPDRSFDSLRGFLWGRDWEGLVFHHSDGRRAKIKRKDFGGGS